MKKLKKFFLISEKKKIIYKNSKELNHKKLVKRKEVKK